MNNRQLLQPEINRNRPDFEFLPGNNMWRVQLPAPHGLFGNGSEHLIRDEAAARKFAEQHGIATS